MSRALCQLAIMIWTWCTERSITLQAEHLLGQLNSQADVESRTVRDRCDWKLNQLVFQQIDVRITLDEAASLLLQLETRSRSRGDGRFHAEMGD